jgi:hypothetical protein
MLDTRNGSLRTFLRLGVLPLAVLFAVLAVMQQPQQAADGPLQQIRKKLNCRSDCSATEAGRRPKV